MDKEEAGIQKDAALRLCTEIRAQYQGMWWTLAGMQCMGCIAASKGDLAKMCVGNGPGYRGCNLVNARYGREAKSAA